TSGPAAGLKLDVGLDERCGRPDLEHPRSSLAFRIPVRLVVPPGHLGARFCGFRLKFGVNSAGSASLRASAADRVGWTAGTVVETVSGSRALEGGSERVAHGPPRRVHLGRTRGWPRGGACES